MEDKYKTRIENLKIIVEELAPKKPYHNYMHCLDVSNTAKEYALSEGLSLQQAHLQETAGLLHDIYHVKEDKENEEKSTIISMLILNKLGYSNEEQDEISKLILATKFPTKPNSLMEMIICDADMSSNGRNKYLETSEQLRMELGIDQKRWYDEIQPKFLSSLKYYTNTAKRLLEDEVNDNLQKVRDARW